MKNLKICNKFTSFISLTEEDREDQSVFCYCFGESGQIFAIEESTKTLRVISKLLPEAKVLTTNDSFEDVLHMQFINETKSLYFGTNQGQFIQFDLNSYIGEELFQFQSKSRVVAFAVSPDSRLVSIISQDGTFLLMSLPNLDVIHEEQFSSWDKDDLLNAVTISWRPDSHYFVLNKPDTKTGRRLYIYDEHGALFSTTEDSTFLVNNIASWSPSGALIAALEKPPIGKQGYLVTFFELNGLKRSSFDPDEGRFSSDGDNAILDIVWSPSSLLALRRDDTVEVWYRDNYVWMLKGIIEDIEYELVEFVAWDPEKQNRLGVVDMDGKAIFYDFSLEISTGYSAGSALVVSINGRNLYATPFRDNSAPPPYGFYQLTVESEVKEVVVSSFWDGFLAILHTGKILVVKNAGNKLSVVRNLVPEDNATTKTVQDACNWIWLNITTLASSGPGYTLLLNIREDLNSADDKSNLEYSISINDFVIDFPSVYSYIIQINDTEILVRNHDQSSIGLFSVTPEKSNLVHDFSNSIKCEDTDKLTYLMKTGDLTTDNINDPSLDFLHLIVHSETTKHLNVYLDTLKFKLSTDCSSVSTLGQYLLFTRIQGTLEIVHIDQLKECLQGVSDQYNPYSRKVEKGATILKCCWNRLGEPTVVLMLPRGNIETIHPRPLIVASIQEQLLNESKRCFSSIMSIMRRHRIDANVLLDELRKVDKEDVLNMKSAFESMVKNVKDSSILVLFVTEINKENWDALELMKETLHRSIFQGENQVVIQPYLATMAKLGLFEEALNSRLILGEENRDVVKSRIKFLSFYADNADTLYGAALGTYDVSLTAVVADCTNKDPKEYLPILNNLRNLPLHKKCFSIDTTLKRWGNGLKSLISDTTVRSEEIIKYVEKHRLFSDALDLLDKEQRSDAEILTKGILVSYAQNMEIHAKYSEASILYKKAGNGTKAIECCLKVDPSWAFNLILQEKEEDREKLFRDMLLNLKQKQDWRNGAKLCEIYLQDYPSAVEYWVSAKEWQSAHELVLRNPSLSEMTSNLIKPKLLNHSTSLSDLLQNLLSESKQHFNRLKIVKAKKEAKKLERNEFGDNFSDTESISTTSSIRSSNATSTQTGRSYRSGKNKRKLERKLHSLKEGSRYEDLAITSHLWDTFTRFQNETKADVANTIQALWRFDFDKEGRTLTALMENTVSEFDLIIKEVWGSFIADDIPLGSNFRISPFGWNSTWDKLFLPFN